MITYRESFDLTSQETRLIGIVSLFAAFLAWKIFLPYYFVAFLFILGAVGAAIWWLRSGFIEVTDVDIAVRSSMGAEVRIRKEEVTDAFVVRRGRGKDVSQFVKESGEMVPVQTKTWYPICAKTLNSAAAGGVVLMTSVAPGQIFLVSRMPKELEKAVKAMLSSPW